MKIGDIELGERPVVLAPMEDVTDGSFRLICKEYGADMTYSEFVSADALVRNIASTTRKLAIDPCERPTAIQVYGREADTVAEAARIVYEQAHPDIIDINFGCPVKKVAGKGAGAGLLRDVPRMLAITRAVVNAVPVPVTAKTRLGWDCNSRIAYDLAEQLQDCGIRALTLHGRTRSQMYTGEADWEEIARVKSNPRLKIPLIGNGDLRTPEGVAEAFSRYGVDGVMVGRASIGAPWIFRALKAGAEGREAEPLSVAEMMGVIRRQIRESVSRIDEYRGILHIRRHLAASPLFKGIPNFRDTRIAMLRADTLDALEAVLTHIETDIIPTIIT
ncbi:MAG: tRNA dihydrouridine synthase DusB [Candidatus Amulumruptor caecigallinarius]|nr:tRNA dihydrouridine synthase DusB [Candidatus Amulumruptor caecigallinarius]MCM1397003.1 tRNA dihydrouridine synthase DusB [Candidatus Amulumruptor caecigallinarius]MCM1454639.1 tRNA dihydrouridine synthase DusB [bacterium]